MNMLTITLSRCVCLDQFCFSSFPDGVITNHRFNHISSETWLPVSLHPSGALWGSPPPRHRLRPAGGIAAAVELGPATAGGGRGGPPRAPARRGPLCRGSFGVRHPAEPSVPSQLHPVGSRLRHVQVRRWGASLLQPELSQASAFSSASLSASPHSSAWISANRWAALFRPILPALRPSPTARLRSSCRGGTSRWIPAGALCAPWLPAGRAQCRRRLRWDREGGGECFLNASSSWSPRCVSVAGPLDAECVLSARGEQGGGRRGARFDRLPWWLQSVVQPEDSQVSPWEQGVHF